MNDIIDTLKIFDAQKIQLTTAINFAFSKDTGEGPVMRAKSDNME